MNNVILCGRLTRDPVIRETTQMTIATYTLAVERARKAPDGTRGADFINCKAFSKTAEFAQNWLHQGMKIIVRGRIETGKYTNKEGQTVYTTEVIVDEHEFAEKKDADDQKTITGSKPTDEFVPIPDNLDDEGLPFS